MNLCTWLDDNQKIFTTLSDEIWGFAELGYLERESAQTLAAALENAGFTLQRGVANIPTAFIASFGNAAHPIIGILGEYDALPGLSQDAVPYKKPLQEEDAGHGCGHNLLGVGGLAACMAIQAAIRSGELRGTIRYYGCPAEEGGAGKAFMTQAGIFDDLDICLTWHPDAFNISLGVNVLANYRVAFRYHGQAAHAAADPFNGRSALDAVELMNIGTNYLREHMPPDARIHYVITNGGGPAPNIVPAEAASLYSIRAPRTDQLNELFERVKDIARGAALMTGTKLDIEVQTGMSNLLLIDSIVDVLQEKMEEIGAPKFSSEEKNFARKISKTFPPGSLETIAAYYNLGEDDLAEIKEDVLLEKVLPAFKSDIIQPGSTDVGNVSWAAPTGQMLVTCMALGTPGHSWQTTAQAGMSIGHKGMMYAAKVLALSAAEYLQNPARLQAAQAEFKTKRRAAKYSPPLPKGSKPPFVSG